MIKKMASILYGHTLGYFTMGIVERREGSVLWGLGGGGVVFEMGGLRDEVE